MKNILLCFLILLISTCTYSQNRLVGGPCEGCEAVFEYGDRELTPVDTLPDFASMEPKIKVTGTIYKPDGTTPAPGVILYVYHTNREGIYATKGGESGWARRHGYIRGWVRTGNDGRYTFYTFKPGSYGSNPAHIHPIILEPGGRYYWLGSYRFAGDPNLDTGEDSDSGPRGGSSGIMDMRREGNLLVGERDIILGKNIPNYN